jgi:ATP-dependent protease Clp ATPase subunit
MIVNKQIIACDFCEQPKTDGLPMVAAANHAAICEICLKACMAIISEEAAKASEAAA